MSRPLVVDTFMLSDELDMLECRLTELEDVVDLFVLAEADVTHSGIAKPFHYAENTERFARWSDRIVEAHAVDIQVIDDDVPEVWKGQVGQRWEREHAQREAVWAALDALGVPDDSIVLHGDVDEIPRPLIVRNIRPKGFITFGQRFHPFAVDWIHPEMWQGTVAARWSDVKRLGSFTEMRHKRATDPKPHMRDAGWHFSWVGGPDVAGRKLSAFCHSEMEIARDHIEGDFFRREGYHVDGSKLDAVEVDETWPRWIVEGHAPKSWFRP